MMDLNIVFVDLKMRDDILRAIRSLKADLIGSSLNVQITVSDNTGNIDGIKEVLSAEFPEVTYIDCGGNVGFGKGNTIGFKATPARYYFALNRDTLIPENSHTLERIVVYMDEHPEVGAMGPKLVNLDGTLQYSCYRFDWPAILIKPLKQINWDEKYEWVRKYTDWLLMKDFDHNHTRPVDWVLGAALVVRQEVVDAIGWFDERYLAYLEDADWCRTMWEHHWPVYYVHDIVIQHAHARDSAKVPGIFRALVKNKTARIHLSSWLKYIWKWRGRYTL
ncbi:MAG: glycosyltransferase [Candidatus Magasanikbacteria bacterium]|nr:glycosyltransferase [Candidatus Magasanikbacteria bacterium]